MGLDLRFLLLAPVFAAVGCRGNFAISLTPHVLGSGPVATAKRNVPPFSKIQAANSLKVDVKYGDKQSVTIEAQKSILPLILSRVSGDQLILETRGSLSTDKPMLVHIVTKSLRGLSASGATEIKAVFPKIAKLDADASGASRIAVSSTMTEVNAEADGASTISFAGSLGKADLSASGASTIEATAVSPEQVSAEADGASKILIGSAKTLSATASGASTITYKGNPKVTKSDASGASTISRSH